MNDPIVAQPVLQGVLAPTPREMMAQGQRSIRRIFLINGLALLSLLLIAGIGTYIWHQGYYFYTTSDAVVSGNIVTAVAPERGVIRTIYHHLGDYVYKGNIIAVVDGVSGPDSGGTVNVIAPIDGTIINEGSNGDGYQLAVGEAVGVDQPVAQVTRLSQLWVTAYVAEDRIKDVHVGQGVDVTVSGSNHTLHGTVRRIVGATAASLDQVPTVDYATGNFVQVTQRVPVQISLDVSQQYPGASATVTIHLHD